MNGAQIFTLLFRDAEELCHLVVQEAVAGLVWLNPLAVEHKLRDCPLAHVGDDSRGTRRRSKQ